MSENERRRMEASSKKLRQALSQYPASEQVATLVEALEASATAVAAAANNAGGNIKQLVPELSERTMNSPNKLVAAWMYHVLASFPDRT